MNPTGLFKQISVKLPGFAGNIGVVLLLTGLFLLAELYLHWVGRIDGILWRKDDVGYILAFFLFMRLVAVPGRAWLTVLFLMQLLQLSEIGYFLFAGSYFGPADLVLLSRQYKDFWGSLSEVAILFLAPALLILISAGISLFVLKRSTGLNFQLGPRSGNALLILWLTIPFIHAYTEDNSMRFDPDPGKTAFRNGINAFSYHLVWDLLLNQRGAAGVLYPDYILSRAVDPVIEQPLNLVVIMGESITHTHMGLYGYERDTTPFLSAMEREGRLIFRPGISSAVSTHVSIPMFFNIQYEPDNRTHIASGETNLYRLAKSKGYQTAFLSSQEMYAIASQVSKGSVDIWKEFEHIEGLPEEFDGKLIATLKSLPFDWDRPFLLTLNPRAGHIPYAKYTPEEFVSFGKGLSRSEYHRYMQSTYDDAMRYFDHVVSEIVDVLRQHIKNPTVVIITSDHGQRLGESTGYGHNTLEFGSARVPFIYLGLNTPLAVNALVGGLDCPVTHYDVGRFIARLLGYLVRSSSETENTYFINGVDLTGRGGYLRYTRSEANEGLDCIQQGL